MPEKAIEKNQTIDGEAYLRGIMDAFPSPVLVIDRSLVIYDSNSAAKRILGGDGEPMPTRLDCHTIGCIHASSIAGQGPHAVECFTCAIRQISSVLCADMPPFKKTATIHVARDGQAHNIHLLVNCAPLHHTDGRHYILTLQDVSGLSGLQRIVPICSFCRNVQNGRDRWEPIHTYLQSFSTIVFSHKICPECARKQYPDLVDPAEKRDTWASTAI
jgi:hypothetical protein